MGKEFNLRQYTYDVLVAPDAGDEPNGTLLPSSCA